MLQCFGLPVGTSPPLRKDCRFPEYNTNRELSYSYNELQNELPQRSLLGDPLVLYKCYVRQHLTYEQVIRLGFTAQ